MTKIYLAPLEGLTGHVFRRCYDKYFGKGLIDKYFIPFISPNTSDGYTTREVRDIDTKNNEGMYAVPQIMANNSEFFLKGAAMLKDMGYREINLNVGCPSGTVVSKYRGAGFLAIPDQLDGFLYEVLASQVMDGMELSVKTRLGMHKEEEFDRILSIYNKYKLKEVIIHARVRADKYNGNPRMEAFDKALKNSVNSVCYNGDINTPKDYVRLLDRYRNDFSTGDGVAKPQAVMIGRGLVADPVLIKALKAEKPLEYERDLKAEKLTVKEFMKEIFDGYLEIMEGDPKAMHKMKEIWVYMGNSFVGGEKILKDIKKAQRISDYTGAVETFFANAQLKPYL